MFKCVASALLFALFVAGASAGSLETCLSDKKYDDYVTDLLNQQINVELTAQYSYLRLAHLFQQPFLYYPKFAEFFREKSLEEMTHAEDFMTYQTQRGVERTNTPGFSMVDITDKVKTCKDIDTLYAGFVCARDLEIFVTSELTKLVSKVSKVKYAPDGDVGDHTYNEELRKSQAVLVSYNDGDSQTQTSLNAATTTTTEITCSTIYLDYIELGEHISHDYLGHQIIDTKVLANAVATLGRCRNIDATFDNTCVFAVERLLKLE